MAAAVAWIADAPGRARRLRFVRPPGRRAARDAESHCTALARSGGALRRALCALAGRFVQKRAWERLGYARAGDYARERLGMSTRELRDLARVDVALRTLPACEAALVAGTLPWTKLRLIARTARPEDESRWIAFARRMSVRRLEQHVRAMDAGSTLQGGADPSPEDANRERLERVHYAVPADVSAKWQLTWRLARRVAGEALGPGEAAEWICAEVLSAIPVDADPETVPPGLTAQERTRARLGQRLASSRNLEEISATTAPEPVPNGLAPAPPAVAALVRDLESADPLALDRRLRRAVALEQRREAELGPLLLRVKEGRLYRGQGFPGLESYAENRLGLSPRKAWALLRIERAARACPELRASYRTGGISWVQAHTLIPVLEMHPSRTEAWIAHARRVTVRRLRDDVDRAVLLAESDAETFAKTAGVPDLEAERRGPAAGAEAEARLQTGAGTRDPGTTSSWAPPGQARIFFRAPEAVARLFRATVCTVRRRLGPRANEGEALDAVVQEPARAPQAAAIPGRRERGREPGDALRLAPPARRTRHGRGQDPRDEIRAPGGGL